jgi:hypothetical protein
MNNEDIVSLRGQPGAYKDSAGGASLYSHPIIGVVKNNIDPLKTGKIQVYLRRQNNTNENDSSFWTTVSYMSPFFGYTENVGSANSDGEFVGNPNSYGFWATPPDIGTEVVCIFINGDPGSGYYIGALPKPGLTQMVPAIGAVANVIPNEGEAESYGGVDRLPTSEYNNANKKQDNSSTVANSPRPVHSYQAAILNKQGLLRDTDRGVIGSSSMRESPSRVFGMSTPGRPIYEGGYNDETIANAIKSDESNEKLKTIGRTGGHTFVMDDGDLQGRDQLMRFRTAQGHMIMMNDYAQTLFIIHANGQSYIELGKEGTIDMYSTNSVNIRTQGDLNLHADNNININATKDLNISAKNINVESTEATNVLTGTEYKQQTKGNHTVKVDGSMSLASDGNSSLKSNGGSTYINGGPNVYLNTGSSPLVPNAVKKLPIVAHTDTLYSSSKGYVPAPGKLNSIVSRAPAHTPWANANQGVDVKVNLDAAANFPAAPSSTVSQVNASVEGAPITPTNPSVASTVPVSSNVTPIIPNASPAATAALVSQMAVNVATGPAAAAVESAAGVVDVDGVKTAVVGTIGATPEQLVDAGVLKPGADVVVKKLVQAGKSVEEAMTGNMFTGKDGVNSVADLAQNVAAQVNVGSTVLKNAADGLTQAGVIKGTESLDQVGGLIMGAASSGVGAVVDYVKKAATAGAQLVANVAGAITNNPLVKNIQSAIASGNFAASLAEKAMGPLAGLSNIVDSVKGVAAGVFDKIVGSIKKLKAKIPQNLAQVNAKEIPAELATAGQSLTAQADGLKNTLDKTFAGEAASAVNAVTGGFGQATNIVTGIQSDISALAGAAATVKDVVASEFDVGVNGVPNIPGGVTSVSNVITNIQNIKIPGIDSVKNAVKSIAGAVTGSISKVTNAIGDLKDKIANKGGLNALAANLPENALAELNGALGSLGSGGPVDIKLPTVAVDTFDFGPLQAQSAALLGNPKIPALKLGSLNIPKSPLSAEQVAKFDTTKTKLDEQENLQFDLRRAYLDAKQKFGDEAPETTAALDAYKTCLQTIENLRKQLGKIYA